MRPCLSPLGEEISQDGLTLAFQHAAVHFRTMADMRIARNIPNRTACTELGIPGTERDGADMGLDAGTRAHRARLKCDGQRAIGEIPSAQGLGRLTHGDDFGVGKRVAISLTRVVSARDNQAGRSASPRHIPYQRVYAFFSYRLMMCIIGRNLNVFFMVPIYFWWRKNTRRRQHGGI